MIRSISKRARLTLGAFFLLSLLIATVASADGHDDQLTYEVTIVNLTEGQPFTPPLIATHTRDIQMFQRNKPANIGIQEIAENGNLAPMIEILEGSDAVSDHVVAIASEPGPLMPRDLVTIEITADSTKDVLSVAAMLICSNDGFTGVNSVRLPNRVGSAKVYGMRGYDAGTEVNTEAWDDIVPPCAPLTGLDNGGAGTGATNPDLAENGRIRPHRGVNGVADLLPELHDWDGAAALIHIVRTQ